MTREAPVYIEELTKRESEVLMVFAQEGLTNWQIGERLSISEKTVEKHLSNIYQKLNFASRYEALIWARENLIANK
jgi:RNA polymerase sigma factor (sigma-70 family)